MPSRPAQRAWALEARLCRLNVGTWVRATTAWPTVISGSWFVYPWYRAEPPSEGAQLQDYPQYYLEEHNNLAYWHEFGMEWKEHVGWLSPILATAVAFIVIRYGPRLVEAGREQRNLRWMLAVLFTVSFLAAAVSGAFGAFINVVAPNNFLDLG